MTAAYTDDDVQAAREAGDRAAELHQPTALHRAGERSRWGCTCQAVYAFQSRAEQAAHIAAESDRAVLDAVAPAIAARALREAARDVTRHLVCADCANDLDRRADEIERTP